MSKFTFILEDDDENSSKMTMEFSNLYQVESIIEKFEDFLQGCGYDVTLGLVSKEDEVEDDSEVSTMDDNKANNAWTWTVGELQKPNIIYATIKGPEYVLGEGIKIGK
jgi:hypothetical protein